MTNAVARTSSWQRRDPVDAESEWEAFLTSKKQAMTRMKAGRVDALRRLGPEKSGTRSVVSELSDDREAPGSYYKENYSVRSEARDAPESVKSGARADLDMRKLIEIFTVIKKRRWDDFLEQLELYPRSASIPCPKNIQSTAKGNLMLHEACRNNPPLRVISALINEYPDAVKAKGGKGYLPVHYACATNSSTDVILKLLDTFPASIRMRDTNDLMIPLHFACKWGASAKTVDILVNAYPEGKQVRDIYAKTPVDYANELQSEERGDVLRTLERSAPSRSDRSFARSVTGSIGSIHDGSSVASREMQRELLSTKAKLEKTTLELNQRERKFSTQYSAEQSKTSELQKQKEILENECFNARIIQDDQKQKIQLLQREVKTLKALHETHNKKKEMLLEKIESLEQEKKNAKSAIDQLDPESSAKIKQELTAAMVEQEIKYKAMLQGEQRKIESLEKKAKEAELTHRHYTMALLQEHENEVSKFEELTSRFKVLEGQLRREIETERTKRIAAEKDADGIDYKQAVEDEKEKVAFLEAHITKVNDLLEAEQKRFAELEEILKETLAIENEQREEIEAEFRDRESEYLSRIEIEGQKRTQLEKAYTDIAEKLKAEIEKTAGLQAYEIELKRELKMDQEKIEELERVQEQTEKALEREKERVQKIEESERNSRVLLKTEELKVTELEQKVEELQSLLDSERQSVKDLKEQLASLHALYDKEIERIKEFELAETEARDQLRILNENVTSLEAQETELGAKREAESSKLRTSEDNLLKMKSQLESGKSQIEKLKDSEEELRELLDAKTQEVKNLEEAPQTESGDASESCIEEKLMEQQASIDHYKYEISALEEKLEIVTNDLEAEREVTKELEESLPEKEAEYEEEREKFEILLKEHGEIQLVLSTERTKILEAEAKVNVYGEQLFFEKESISEMQRMVDQAKIDLQSKVEEVASLEEEEKQERDALDASVKKLDLANDEVASLSESLKDEKEKVDEMAVALKEVQDLVQEEKNRAVEYKRLLDAQKELALADQAKIRELERKIEEQLDALGLGKAENLKLEKDLSATKQLLDEETDKVAELLQNGHNFGDSRASSLLEAEQNKVKALEHSCEQLMSLLDWEKKHVLSLEERTGELKEQADSSSEELVETKKALEESQKKVLKLTHELDNFENMKKEVIRLTLVARQRDIMMAAMLYAIGDAKAIKSQIPVQNAEIYINELETRALGLDLAGMDEAVHQDRESRQLVAYEASARNRTVRNIVLPLAVAGALVEYHHHDPTVLRELAVNVGQLSGDLRANIGEFSHTLGDLSSSIGAGFTTNMGSLASMLRDTSILRETIAQASGLVSPRRAGSS